MTGPAKGEVKTHCHSKVSLPSGGASSLPSSASSLPSGGASISELLAGKLPKASGDAAASTGGGGKAMPATGGAALAQSMEDEMAELFGPDDDFD